MSNIYSTFSPQVQMPELIDPKTPLFVGLECEIESILGHGSVGPMFNVVADHSLRNNGLEFVSCPTPATAIVGHFTELHKSLKFRNLTQKFSERTSIHVHVNCCNLEEQDVRNIILMYALFEEYFFMMASPSRRHNIHCVALTETYLPSLYKNKLTQLVSKWHKYTALNIKPLAQYGTIEFRHMQGHDDPALLDQWIKTINNLMQVGVQNPINKKTLTSDNIKRWFQQIFGDTNLSLLSNSIDDVAFNQIIDLKLAVL